MSNEAACGDHFGLLVTALLTAGATPRVGFVAYPGTHPTPSSVPQAQPATVIGSSGFNRGDFGLGAAAMLGLVLVTGGVVGGRRIPRPRTS